TDGTWTDDDHDTITGITGPMQSMDGHGQRLREDRRLERQPSRDGDELRCLDNQALAKTALDMRERGGAAKKGSITADVVPSCLTQDAPAAWSTGVDGYPSPDHPGIHSISCLGDDPDHFVAQDHGFPDAEVADRALEEVAQIGAADATDGDGDLDLVGADGLALDVLDAEVMRSVDHAGTVSVHRHITARRPAGLEPMLWLDPVTRASQPVKSKIPSLISASAQTGIGGSSPSNVDPPRRPGSETSQWALGVAFQSPSGASALLGSPRLGRAPDRPMSSNSPTTMLPWP